MCMGICSDVIEKYKGLIFISLSNKNPEIRENIISIGISLESQINAIEKFIIKKNKKKTIIIFRNYACRCLYRKKN